MPEVLTANRLQGVQVAPARTTEEEVSFFGIPVIVAKPQRHQPHQVRWQGRRVGSASLGPKPPPTHGLFSHRERKAQIPHRFRSIVTKPGKEKEGPISITLEDETPLIEPTTLVATKLDALRKKAQADLERRAADPNNLLDNPDAIKAMDIANSPAPKSQVTVIPPMAIPSCLPDEEADPFPQATSTVTMIPYQLERGKKTNGLLGPEKRIPMTLNTPWGNKVKVAVGALNGPIALPDPENCPLKVQPVFVDNGRRPLTATQINELITGQIAITDRRAETLDPLLFQTIGPHANDIQRINGKIVENFALCVEATYNSMIHKSTSNEWLNKAFDYERALMKTYEKAIKVLKLNEINQSALFALVRIHVTDELSRIMEMIREAMISSRRLNEVLVRDEEVRRSIHMLESAGPSAA